MSARFGAIFCVLVALSLSLVGCDRTITKARVNLLFDEKKYQDVIDILTPHLKSDSSDTESYFHRGLAYARLDQYDKALADFDKALSLNPNHGTALKLRAKCLVDLAKYEEAKIAYTAVIDQGPEEVASYFGRARCYDALGEHDLAIADLEKALQLDPADASSHYLLALLLASSPNDTLRDGKRAVEEAHVAVELIDADSAQHWQAVCCLAAAFAECGEFEKAIELQQEGLALALGGKEKQDAERTLARYHRGEPYRRTSDRSVREAAARIVSLFKEKKYQEVVDAFTPHLEREPSDVDGFLMRGVAYCRLERFEEGLADFEKALALKPDHSSALKSRAKCLLDLRRYPEAVEAYHRVIEQNPDEENYYVFRAAAYCNSERVEEGLADLDKALSLKPDHKQAHIDRAMCLLGLERYQEAIDVYNRLIEESPDTAPFYLNRSYCYEALRKYDLAIADAEETLRLDASKIRAHFLLARILSICPLEELRDPKRAIEEAEAVISMTHSGSEPYSLALGFIAAAHSQQGKFEKAIEVQEKGLAYLTNERDQKDAQEALEGYRSGKPYPRKKESVDDSAAEPVEPAKASE